MKRGVATGNHKTYFDDVNQSGGAENMQISVVVVLESVYEWRDLEMNRQRCRNTIDIVELFHIEQQRFMM
ncbi:hypothetical protein [Rhodococcus opacus]|uniref:hypothetical protein n=1 Tax=Rhodococcus opacus TaxID=37919 RepID=UPI002476621B|nr:hypothetical protein [Rhodococcus opacus]MDH6288345.1 hypothetical protein [Rhodococcus opacus]